MKPFPRKIPKKTLSNRQKSPSIKEKHQLSLMLILSGSPGRIRTYDQSLNRRLRYHCATGEYTHLPKNTNNLTGVVTDNFLVKIFATPSRPALRGSDLA